MDTVSQRLHYVKGVGVPSGNLPPPKKLNKFARIAARQQCPHRDPDTGEDWTKEYNAAKSTWRKCKKCNRRWKWNDNLGKWEINEDDGIKGPSHASLASSSVSRPLSSISERRQAPISVSSTTTARSGLTHLPTQTPIFIGTPRVRAPSEAASTAVPGGNSDSSSIEFQDQWATASMEAEDDY